jgi:hypothetical protein
MPASKIHNTEEKSKRVKKEYQETIIRKFVKAARPVPVHEYYPQSPSPIPRTGLTDRLPWQDCPDVGFPQQRLQLPVRARNHFSSAPVHISQKVDL